MSATASSELSVAAAALAKRAADVRAGRHVKQADWMADLKNHLSSYGQAAQGWWNNQQPAVQYGLGGAALGGLAGLGADMAGEEHHPFNSLLTGALAGGGMGAGLGAMQSSAEPIIRNTSMENAVAAAQRGPGEPGLASRIGGGLSSFGEAVHNHPLLMGASTAPFGLKLKDTLQRVAARPSNVIDPQRIREGLIDRGHAFGLTPEQTARNLSRESLVRATIPEGQALKATGWRSMLPFLRQTSTQLVKEEPHMGRGLAARGIWPLLGWGGSAMADYLNQEQSSSDAARQTAEYNEAMKNFPQLFKHPSP